MKEKVICYQHFANVSTECFSRLQEDNWSIQSKRLQSYLPS